VGRARAVHRDAPPLPAARGRHLLPLRLARDPAGGGGPDPHHLQDPLQLGGRHDRRAGRGRRRARARADAPARRRGGPADPRADRRAGEVPAGCTLGARGRGLAPGPPR
jgi:hypothetical protein